MKLPAACPTKKFCVPKVCSRGMSFCVIRPVLAFSVVGMLKAPSATMVPAAKYPLPSRMTRVPGMFALVALLPRVIAPVPALTLMPPPPVRERTPALLSVTFPPSADRAATGEAAAGGDGDGGVGELRVGDGARGDVRALHGAGGDLRAAHGPVRDLRGSDRAAGDGGGGDGAIRQITRGREALVGREELGAVRAVVEPHAQAHVGIRRRRSRGWRSCSRSAVSPSSTE